MNPVRLTGDDNIKIEMVNRDQNIAEAPGTPTLLLKTAHLNFIANETKK